MANDRAQFWQLLEPEFTRANLFCRKLAGDCEQGDDLFQDGLVAGLTKFGSLRDRDSFRPWLYRILINTYRSRMRRPWWRRLAPLTAAHEQALAGNDPEDRYAARRWLERGLSQLGPDDRTLVVLHELDGWPLTELSAVYGKTENALAARLARARKKLRSILETDVEKLNGTDSVPAKENG